MSDDDEYDYCHQCGDAVLWVQNDKIFTGSKGYWLIVDDGNWQWTFCSQRCIVEYIKADKLPHLSDGE